MLQAPRGLAQIPSSVHLDVGMGSPVVLGAHVAVQFVPTRVLVPHSKLALATWVAGAPEHAEYVQQ